MEQRARIKPSVTTSAEDSMSAESCSVESCSKRGSGRGIGEPRLPTSIENNSSVDYDFVSFVGSSNLVICSNDFSCVYK